MAFALFATGRLLTAMAARSFQAAGAVASATAPSPVKHMRFYSEEARVSIEYPAGLTRTNQETFIFSAFSRDESQGILLMAQASELKSFSDVTEGEYALYKERLSDKSAAAESMGITGITVVMGINTYRSASK